MLLLCRDAVCVYPQHQSNRLKCNWSLNYLNTSLQFSTLPTTPQRFNLQNCIRLQAYWFMLFYICLCISEKLDLTNKGEIKYQETILFIIYYHYYIAPSKFLHLHWWIVFHPSVSKSKSPQVLKTLLTILADLSNAVVWIVSACPLISDSFSFLTMTLGAVPGIPIIIGITITFMFHSFFSSLAISKNLSLFFSSLILLLLLFYSFEIFSHHH